MHCSSFSSNLSRIRFDIDLDGICDDVDPCEGATILVSAGDYDGNGIIDCEGGEFAPECSIVETFK